MGSLATPMIRKVAIIGAGPGGTAAAKYLRAENRFDQIDIFEQQDTYGGVWTLSPRKSVSDVSIPQTNPIGSLDEPVIPDVFLTPMYEGLETNIPYNLMKYSDTPFVQPQQVFPPRASILQYLVDYGEDVRNLTKFKTQVIDVRWERESLNGNWSVKYKEIDSGKTTTHVYDAVVVANGHYSVPYIPEIKGIRDWNHAYPESIAHSKFYQNPSEYKGKRVVVVGNSASGFDIAHQLSTVALHPILNSNRSDSPHSFDASWKKMVPEIEEFLPSSTHHRALRLKDGRIEADIDAVLFCTGYFYSFPFLPSLREKLIGTGERVKNLFRQVFYIDCPSLAFIGLPAKIIPFRTFEGQAAVIARVWADRLSLPSTSAMKLSEERDIIKQGSGKTFHTLPFPQDFDYHNKMVDWALMAKDPQSGKLPSKWSLEERWERSKIPLIKKDFSERGEYRQDVKRVEDLGFKYDEAMEEKKQEEVLP